MLSVKRLRRVLLAALSLALWLSCTWAPSAALAPVFARARIDLPACVPLREPVEGQWSRKFPSPFDGNCTPPGSRCESSNTLRFTPRVPCRYAVSTRAEAVRALAGRRLLFIGDSQVREFLYDAVIHLEGCCPLRGACSAALAQSQQRDASRSANCARVASAGSYPEHPVVFDLAAPGGRNATLVFLWAPYPKVLLDPQDARSILPYLDGCERADAFVASWGHWDLIFDKPEWEAPGLIFSETAKVADALAAAEAARPGLLRAFVWRRMYPDEVDAFPHPTHHKRNIKPGYRALTIEGLSRLWQNATAHAGGREWVLTHMLDVRLGNVTRPVNENFLTFDGMHLWPEVNVALLPELLSHWAAVLGDPVEA